MEQRYLERIFLRFSHAYGTRFTSYFADQATKDDWLNCFNAMLEEKRIAPNEIKYAIGEMIIKHPSFPPSMGEFLSLCLAGRKPEPFIALPMPSIDEERIRDMASAFKTVLETPKQDSREWARWILREVEKGNYKYNYGIDLAKEALRL